MYSIALVRHEPQSLVLGLQSTLVVASSDVCVYIAFVSSWISIRSSFLSLAPWHYSVANVNIIILFNYDPLSTAPSLFVHHILLYLQMALVPFICTNGSFLVKKASPSQSGWNWCAPCFEHSSQLSFWIAVFWSFNDHVKVDFFALFWFNSAYITSIAASEASQQCLCALPIGDRYFSNWSFLYSCLINSIPRRSDQNLLVTAVPVAVVLHLIWLLSKGNKTKKHKQI